MKKAALLVPALFLVLAMTGCKTEMEKAADAVCACAEKTGDDAKKCMDDAKKNMPDKGSKGDTKLGDMNEKDKAAAGRMMGCAMKLESAK